MQIRQGSSVTLGAGRPGMSSSSTLLIATIYFFVASLASLPERGKNVVGCQQCSGTCHLELGRCDCPRGYSGPDCRTAPSDPEKECKKFLFHASANCSHDAPLNQCLNACNQRGVCTAGWCHCHPGYYGGDCSLSLGPDGRPELLAGLGYKPRSRRPLIYVYELPPRFNTWHNIRVQDRPLWFLLYQRLLSSGVRTADGDAADYFYLPMNIRGPSESMAMIKAVEYVRQHWPWWDGLRGARHVIVHTGDVGRMDMVEAARQLTINSTWLTHWGLYEDYPSSGWKKAHRPGLDIVVPILIGSMSPRANAFKYSPLHPLHPERADHLALPKRDLEVLFAGRICGGREVPDSTKWPNCRPINVGYSQGVRQLMHFHHWNRTGFKINVTNPNYLQDLARTRFCLAPPGGGHGHRQILVAFSGCVPLLIGDHIYQPFEPELDWSRFSLSLPQEAIPKLHEILAGIDAHRYKKLLVALRCGAEHLTYSSFIGSFKWDRGKYDAFETIMEILRSRLLNPGLAPEALSEVDDDLRAFMECHPPEFLEQGLEWLSPNMTLCSLSELDAKSTHCLPCVTRHNGIIPGGAACCDAQSLAQCPRSWE